MARIIIAKSKFNDVVDKVDLIISWRRNGLTNEEIANNLGVSRISLYNYSKKDINIFNALNESKEILDAKIEDALVMMIFDENGTKTERLNAIKYYEATRTKHMPVDKRESLKLRAEEIRQKTRENDIEEQKIVISELGDVPNE